MVLPGVGPVGLAPDLEEYVVVGHAPFFAPRARSQELVPGFIVNGTGNSGAVITAYLFVVGSITGSAYGFTATVGLQMCLLDGGANAQCYPNVPEPLFTQCELTSRAENHGQHGQHRLCTRLHAALPPCRHAALA